MSWQRSSSTWHVRRGSCSCVRLGLNRTWAFTAINGIRSRQLHDSLQDDLAERDGSAAEQPAAAAQSGVLEEEAAVAVRPDPDEDAANGEFVATLLALFCRPVRLEY